MEVDIYTTIQMDTWDLISYKVYGSTKYVKELIEANLKYCEVVFFEGDIDLICPDIEERVNKNLPEWRR